MSTHFSLSDELDLEFDWMCDHCHMDDFDLEVSEDFELYSDIAGTKDPAVVNPYSATLSCNHCHTEIEAWYLSYDLWEEDDPDQGGRFQIHYQWLRDPAELDRELEEARVRREQLFAAREIAQKEAENPLWVVVQIGEHTEEWPVYLTKEEAVANYQARVKELRSDHISEVRWHQEEEGRSWEHQGLLPREKGTIVRNSCFVRLHEGMTSITPDWEITIGYGKFVITETEDK